MTAQGVLDFAGSGQPAFSVLPLVSANGDADGLRGYQRDAVTRIHEQLGENRSTLLVMATGLGKTQTFGAVAKHWPGTVLVIAHRDELIQQARKRLEVMTGELVGVEQAQWYAGMERIVVASVQSLSRPDRMQRFTKNRFSLVIIDEAHHAIAASYRAILDYFADAKVLGVTATPDRADEQAMGQVFESVAYVRDIQDAIGDGYLVPIRVQRVHVDTIDLSGVHTVAGDLNAGELDAVMAVEETLHGIVQPTLELAADRRAIVFTTSVENAHRMAEVFNRYRTGCARAVDGGTAFDERRALLRGHASGDYQILCNVGVLTEGYDDPGVSLIAMARPTKSRSLYAQCAGRGLRTLPGLVENVATDELRRAAIAASAKPDCLLLDFVGNAGRHRLVSALDILGGRYDDPEVVEKAEKLADKNPGIDAQEALERAQKELQQAREREAAKRARLKAKQVGYRTQNVDPFGVLGIEDPGRWSHRFGGAPATEKQIACLTKWKVELPKDCTKQQASKLIGTCIQRRDAGLATFKQVKMLQRFGITEAPQLPFNTARRLMDAIVQNGWHINRAEADSIIASREMGEDG